MKKILTLSIAMFTLAIATLPASACLTNLSVVENENVAEIINDIYAESNSGNNTISYHKDPDIRTGGAYATADVRMTTNKNIGKVGRSYSAYSENGAYNRNILYANNIITLQADSGNNAIFGKGDIRTGGAVSSANVVIVSNLNVGKVK